MSSTSVNVSIPLTFSPKRCGTGHTFGGCGILSCVAYPTFFSSHFWSSIISRSQLLTRLLVRWYPRLHLRRQLLLFYGSVFHSHMPDHLSHLSSVACGSSAYTTPSSHCSVRYALRSDMGRMVLFLPIVHGRKDGGCCSTCTLRVSLTFLVECHVDEPRGPSLVL